MVAYIEEKVKKKINDFKP